MPAFRKVYISSSHRVSGTSSSFTYEIKDTVTCPHRCHVAVCSVSVPNVMQTVQSNVNSKVYLYLRHSTESLSQNVVLDIPAGAYTNATLAVALQSALNAVALSGVTISVNYSSITLKMTITESGGSGFLIYSDHTLQTLGRKNPASNGLYNGTGVVANPQSLQNILNVPNPGEPSPVATVGPIILNRIHELYLRSPNLGNFKTLCPVGRRDVCKKIPVNVDHSFVITTPDEFTEADLIDVSGRSIKNLEFSLTDVYGNVVNIFDLPISFTLAFVFADVE